MEKLIQRTVAEIGKVLLGKDDKIRLSLCCLFARGHLLIEDLPGMGKTTLSHALATLLGLSYNRIQFTSDLLPADILGSSIFNRDANKFIFHSGPIFSQVLLADEINRTTPKTQSALLEAMEEGQVTIDGETRVLPKPFFVIATQNPLDQAGTFPLPESQLDRFLMRIELGYPDPKAERAMLVGGDTRQHLAQLQRTISDDQLRTIQEAVDKVRTSDSLLDYIQRILAKTRAGGDFPFGLSPRAAVALIRAAKTWALMQGRSHVIPEDLQMVLVPVAGHRLGEAGYGLAQKLIQWVPVI